MVDGSAARLQIGDQLPPIDFGPITRATLALFAGASGDHNPIHIDIDYAREAGVPDVFAHGMLSFGVLTRLVTAWCGIERLREVGARFVTVTDVGAVVRCSGEIVEQVERDGESLLRVAIRASVGDGRQTLVGEALVRAW